MSTVNGFQVGSETLKYNYESLDNYNTPNFSTSSSKTYAVGDYVMYNGKLYKCTTATTGGTWVSGSWTLVVLSDDVSNLSRQISDVESEITVLTNTSEIALTYGKYRSFSTPFTESLDSNFCTALIRCSAGDVFYVCGKGGASARLYDFVDTNGSYLYLAGSTFATNNYIRLIAPTNTAYLVFNSMTNDPNYTPSVVSGEYLPSSFGGLDNVLEDGGNENIQWDANSTRDQPTPLLQTYYLGWTSVLCECKKGDVFKLKGKGGSSSRLYSFLDADGTPILSSAVQQLAEEYITITAPENAKYLVCNSNANVSGLTPSLVRVWAFSYDYASAKDEEYKRIEFTSTNLTNGTAGQNPALTDSLNRIRLPDLTRIFAGDILTFSAGTKITKYAFVFYDEKFRFVRESGFITAETYSFNVSDYSYASVVFAASGDADIAPSDFDATCYIISRVKSFAVENEKSLEQTATPQKVLVQEPVIAQMCRYGKTALRSHDPQMLIVTDSHGDITSVKNAIEYTNRFSEYFDACVHCGDYIGNYIPLSNTDSSFVETRTFKYLIQNSAVPVYFVVGNHEKGTYPYIGTTPTDSDLYSYFIKPIVDKGWLAEGEYMEDKCYYYHDFTSQKVRLIVVDIYMSDMDIDTTYWTPITYNSNYSAIVANTEYSIGDHVNVPGYTAYSFEAVQAFNSGTFTSGKWPKYKAIRGYGASPDQASAQWFLDTLLSTPQNYKVVVAMHKPHSVNDALVITSKFCQDYVAYSPEGDYIPQDFYADAINAFVNGSNFSIELTPLYGSRFTVSKNFASKNTGVTFHSLIGGHWHRDLVFKHSTYNQYQICPIDANSTYAPQSTGNDICRTIENGNVKDCLTAVTFRTGELGLAKLGVDRTINGTYRDFEVLDIS